MSISHPKFTIGAISLVVSQTTYKEVVQSQEVRPLLEKLNNILVFNSNSPEGVTAFCTIFPFL